MVPAGARLRASSSPSSPATQSIARSNALARGQFLQACPEILIGCADDLIASEVANNCFLLPPPDDVDCLESVMPHQLKHELPHAGCSRRLQKPLSLLEFVS